MSMGSFGEGLIAGRSFLSMGGKDGLTASFGRLFASGSGRAADAAAESSFAGMASKGVEEVAEGAETAAAGANQGFFGSLASKMGRGVVSVGRGAKNLLVGGVKKAGVGLGAGAAGLGMSLLKTGGEAAGWAATIYAAMKLVKWLVEKYVFGDAAMKGTGPGMVNVAESEKAVAEYNKNRVGLVGGQAATAGLQAQANPDQMGRLAVRNIDGRYTEMQLPYMKGANDVDTLQKTTDWWNVESKKGFVPPIGEGSRITLGHPGNERGYAMHDGKWTLAAPFSMTGTALNGRQMGQQPVQANGQSDAAQAPLMSTEVPVSGVRNLQLLPSLSMHKTLAAGLGMGDEALLASRSTKVSASLDPDGSRRLTAMNLNPDSASLNVLSVSSNGRSGSMMATSEQRGPNGGFMRRDAIAGVGQGLVQSNQGVAVAPGVSESGLMQTAGRLNKSVQTPDALSTTLNGSSLQGMSSRITKNLDDPSSVSATFVGKGPDGLPVRGGMQIKNGSAQFQTFDVNGTTQWSKTIKDSGFAVGPDGAVQLSGKALDYSKGFINDPRSQARVLDGLEKNGSGRAAAIAGVDMPSIGSFVDRALQSGKARPVGAGIGL